MTDFGAEVELVKSSGGRVRSDGGRQTPVLEEGARALSRGGRAADPRARVAFPGGTKCRDRVRAAPGLSYPVRTSEDPSVAKAPQPFPVIGSVARRRAGSRSRGRTRWRRVPPSPLALDPVSRPEPQRVGFRLRVPGPPRLQPVLSNGAKLGDGCKVPITVDEERIVLMSELRNTAIDGAAGRCALAAADRRRCGRRSATCRVPVSR